MKTVTWIVVLGTSVGAALWFHLGRGPTMRAPFVQAVAGDVISRPDNRPWCAPGGTALVMITIPTCSACQASKEFSEELYDWAHAHGVPAFYVLPNRFSADEVARSLAAKGRYVFRVELSEFGVFLAPTFLRIDRRGEIQSAWSGSIPAERHDEIFASLVSGRSLEAYRTILASEFDSYRRKNSVQVVALSEARRRAGVTSKVIPLDELGVRAEYELDRTRLTLLDCGAIEQTRECQAAAMWLAKMKFNVVAAGLPRWSSGRDRSAGLHW